MTAAARKFRKKTRQGIQAVQLPNCQKPSPSPANRSQLSTEETNLPKEGINQNYPRNFTSIQKKLPSRKIS
jgi:hypothetical protein